MAIADPQILLVLNESSGTTVTNDGTLGDVSVGQGVEDTDWAWHPDEGLYDGFWESFTEGGASQAWLDCSALAFASPLVNESVATRFSLDAFDTRASSLGYLLGLSGDHGNNGAASIFADNPTSTGDFNLVCQFFSRGGLGNITHTFEDLTFGVEYALSMSVDVSTVTACQGRFKLDAGTVQAPATTDKSGETLDTTGPYIGRSRSFTNYFGIDGRVFYVAYWRGYALTATELGDVNTDPQANIPLWPSVGGGESLSIPIAMRHYLRMANQ